MDDGTMRLFEDYARRQSVIARVPLSQVEAFYEVLEDVIGTTVIAGIDACYRDALSEVEANCILADLVPFVGGLNVLESCWRRFIIRYIRSGSDAIKMDPGDDFIGYVELIRWPRGVDIESNDRVGSNGLLGKLKVKHVCSVLQLVWEQQRPKLVADRAATAPVLPNIAAGGAGAGAGAGGGAAGECVKPTKKFGRRPPTTFDNV